MRQLLLGLRGKHTIVLSSHILTEISQTCDRLLVLREGEIVASGTEAELSTRLAKGVEVEMTVRGATDQAKASLGKVEGVVAIDTLAPREPGCTTLRIEAKSDVRDALCRALVEGGFGILEVVRRRWELESIFLKLTSDESGDEAGDDSGDEPGEAPQGAEAGGEASRGEASS